MSENNNNKFHFVTGEELESFFKEDNSEKNDNQEPEKEVEVQEETKKEDNILPETETKEESTKTSNDNESSKEKYKINNRPYFSFEVRVILMLLGILALFAISCFFITKAVKYGSNETISYNETSKANYQVCLNENNIYQDSCLGEDMQYVSSLVHNISTSFEYDVDFSDIINYDINYDVVGILEIYDANDSAKSLLNQEEKLLNKTQLTDENNNLHLSANVNIDYSKYNNIVEEYKKRYNLDLTASLKVMLFVYDNKDNRNVSYINIPLGNQTFNITKSNISNTNQKVKITVNRWNKNTIIYGSIATFLLLLSLFLLFKMTRLVWKVTNNRNKYQAKLSQILREYDRIIVIARDGYESNVNKKIIKVENFDELLDARETLEKPIIYSKVNSVKSEFIVEDDEKLYKYVFKEADI